MNPSFFPSCRDGSPAALRDARLTPAQRPPGHPQGHSPGHPPGTAASAARKPPVTSPWHTLLPGTALQEEHIALLQSQATLRWCRRGDVLLHQGQAATALLAVASGQALIGRGAVEPGQLHPPVRRWAHGPQWLDVHTAWLGRCYGDEAWVGSPTLQLIEWPMALARPWLADHPPLLQALATALAEQVHHGHRALHELVSKDAPGRLAGWMLDHVDDGGRLLWRGHRRELSAQLGMSRPTLARAWRLLIDAGLIVQERNCLHIVDWHALRVRAGRR